MQGESLAGVAGGQRTGDVVREPAPRLLAELGLLGALAQIHSVPLSVDVALAASLR